MKPLQYQTSHTPRRRFQRFNAFEERLGSAGLISLACGVVSGLPLISALAAYVLTRVKPGIIYALAPLLYPLVILLLPLAVLSLALPPIGAIAACFGLSGPKRRFAIAGLCINVTWIVALITLPLLRRFLG